MSFILSSFVFIMGKVFSTFISGTKTTVDFFFSCWLNSDCSNIYCLAKLGMKLCSFSYVMSSACYIRCSIQFHNIPQGDIIIFVYRIKTQSLIPQPINMSGDQASLTTMTKTFLPHIIHGLFRKNMAHAQLIIISHHTFFLTFVFPLSFYSSPYLWTRYSKGP